MSAVEHADVLPASWYARPAEHVARDLIGRVIVSTVDDVAVAGRIVETEAYVGPHDAASHAAERIGRTARNASMFGEPGTAYVYRIYGVHWCLNIVTDAVDFPAAVLIRAIEPVDGIEQMRRRRFRTQKSQVDSDIASGPGRLAEALGVTGTLDGHRLQRPPLVVTAGTPVLPDRIIACTRIGVTRAQDWPLRFCERTSPWVSRRS